MAQKHCEEDGKKMSFSFLQKWNGLKEKTIFSPRSLRISSQEVTERKKEKFFTQKITFTRSSENREDRFLDSAGE